mgnify:CR=1 FL=1
MNLFIASDKQGSGKTFISAGIAATMQSLGYSVGYYKPIQTGAMNQNGFVTSQDITFIKKIDPNLNTVTSYTFQTDAFPILAAKKENVVVQPEVLVKDYLKLRKTSEIVIVESSGGILTPFCSSMRTIDFIQAMQTSMLLVVEPTHEVLEKVLLTIDYVRHAGITVSGVILNKYIKSPDLNIKKLPAMIEAYSGVPIVGIVGYQMSVSPSGLIDTVLHSIDLETIFKMKIPKLSNPADNNF